MTTAVGAMAPARMLTMIRKANPVHQWETIENTAPNQLIENGTILSADYGM
jgi:hypothetical protein